MKTKSEEVFEKFLNINSILFQKIEEATSHRPDYLISAGALEIIFEVKELSEDKHFSVRDPVEPDIELHSRTLGSHVRGKIKRARKQIQYGADRGIASVLLIYNNIDPVFQMFGTEDHDFITAMYGEYTIFLDKNTKKILPTIFNGNNDMLTEFKNTSYSSVGRLCDRSGVITVTLFQNLFSKIDLPFEQLPSCFEVQRFSMSSI